MRRSAREIIPMPPRSLLTLAAVLVGCTAPHVHVGPMELEFLTRDGCGGSEELRANLDEVLADLGPHVSLEVIDVETLGADDPRTGYGTPTILRDGKELFGGPRPAPAAPT